MVGDLQLVPKEGKDLDDVDGEVTMVMVFRDSISTNTMNSRLLLFLNEKVNLNGDVLVRLKPFASVLNHAWQESLVT